MKSPTKRRCLEEDCKRSNSKDLDSSNFKVSASNRRNPGKAQCVAENNVDFVRSPGHLGRSLKDPVHICAEDERDSGTANCLSAPECSSSSLPDASNEVCAEILPPETTGNETSHSSNGTQQPSCTNEDTSAKRSTIRAVLSQAHNSSVQDSASSMVGGLPGSSLSSNKDVLKAIDKVEWQGFCEIESDPALFTVMLKEFGVHGVRVDEVFDLDMLTTPDHPTVYGLVFLHRYLEKEKCHELDSCPDRVWFANQIAINSCATMAMLNIVNNVPNLELGDNLKNFKDFTKDLSPKQRGEALMHFEYIKRIHNSFARRSDMLEADLAMKNRFMNYTQQEKERHPPLKYDDTGKKISGCETNDSGEFSQKGSGKSSNTSTKRRSKPRKTKTSDTRKRKYEEYVEEAAFHFVSFMPIAGELWKLDGMDESPTNIGPFDEGLGWLEAIKPIIEMKMAEVDGELTFNLMALLKDPLIESQNALAENIRTISAIQGVLSSANPSWRDFKTDADDDPELLLVASNEFGLTEDRVAQAILPPSVEMHLKCDGAADLMTLRRTWVKQQRRARLDVLEAIKRNEADELKACHRRIDYGEFIAEWVRILAEGGHIKLLVEELGL